MGIHDEVCKQFEEKRYKGRLLQQHSSRRWSSAHEACSGASCKGCGGEFDLVRY